MIVSKNTIQAEGLGDLFKNLGKSSVEVGKNLGKNVMKNSGRALEIGANVGCAFVSRSSKADFSSLAEVISFYHTDRGLYLPRFA